MEKEILDNGITLWKDPVKEANTIGVLIGVNIGSIYEDSEYRGISHLLEHMMFKSNRKYTAEQINMGLELNGGIANAFTTTYLTGFAVEVIPEGFEKVIDILFSMFENDRYDQKEFENEKKVVLSELERSFNDPENRMYDLIPSSVFGKSDYGDPVIGYRETVENITREILEEYKAKYYVPDNIFIVLSGKFDERHIKLIKEYFEKLEGNKVKRKIPSRERGKDVIIEMDVQNQIYYSLNFCVEKPLYYSSALGYWLSGGLSSLVFQIIREKYGIGYNVLFDYSYIYPDSNIVTLAIPGFEKDKEKKLDLAIEEVFTTIEKKDLSEYYEGRIRKLKLLYEKGRINIFNRIWSEAKAVSLYGWNYDEYFQKIFELDLETLKDFVLSLKDGRIVKIVPKV